MILPKRAGLPNHPMAWNKKSDRVRTNGAADCAGGTRLADGHGKAPITRESTCRNLQKCTPNPELKWSCPNKRAKPKPPVTVGWSGENFAGQFRRARIRSPEFRVWPLGLEKLAGIIGTVIDE